MSTLHTVNKSPFERSALASALKHLKPGDAVLMIEDAVTGARTKGAFADFLVKAAQNCSIYVLGPDLRARGMKEADVIADAKLVDYEGFVDLVSQHDRTQAWL